ALMTTNPLCEFALTDLALGSNNSETFCQRFPQSPFSTPDLQKTIYSGAYGLQIDYALSSTALLSLGRQHFSHSSALDELAQLLAADVDFERIFGVNDFSRSRRLSLLRVLLLQPTMSSLTQGFYDFSTDVGVNFDVGEHSLSIDYMQNKRALTGDYIRSAEIAWQHALNGPMDLRITAGVIDSEESSSLTYAGVGVLFYH
ncbi:MAG: hypothetical protein ACR2PS_12310, partial [Pseudomonadales bacterium]